MRKGGQKGGHAPAWNKGETKHTDVRIAKQAEAMTGENNHFFGKKHKPETIERIKGVKRLTRDEYIARTTSRPEFTCLTSYEDYFDRQAQHLSFRCEKCGEVSEKSLKAFEMMSRCYICQPDGSKEQHEIADFVRSLGFDVIDNDRAFLGGKEIDIWIPSAVFGIEFNGLYYHSHDETGRKDRHLEKTKMCHERGARLMHVFTDEWRDKSDIIKSMIRHRLNIQSRKLHARKCVVRNIDEKTAKSFFERTHISGSTGGCVANLGLFYGEELVSVLSLRRPRQSKKYENHLEIARFSTELDTHVMGGLGKLLKHAIEEARVKGASAILTYADLRFGRGSGYVQVGFEPAGMTALDYWYNDGVLRYNRFKFRARDGLTERELAEAAKVRRIYGCGSMRYLLRVETKKSPLKSLFFDRCVSEGLRLKKNESVSIRYRSGDGAWCDYVPDFFALDKPLVYEVKSSSDENINIKKWDAARDWCKANGKRFIIVEMDDEGNLSETEYT